MKFLNLSSSLFTCIILSFILVGAEQQQKQDGDVKVVLDLSMGTPGGEWKASLISGGSQTLDWVAGPELTGQHVADLPIQVTITVICEKPVFITGWVETWFEGWSDEPEYNYQTLASSTTASVTKTSSTPHTGLASLRYCITFSYGLTLPQKYDGTVHMTFIYPAKSKEINGN